jgi:hypothetical protein
MPVTTATKAAAMRPLLMSITLFASAAFVPSANIEGMSSFVISTRRRPNALPPTEKGKHESQARFEARMVLRAQIAEAKVTVEVDEDGREWTVRRLRDSFAE